MAETKRKILLVDDEPAILKILSIKLKISGYAVVTAPGGQEAIEAFKSDPPDLMVLDVIMPGMDGFEVLEKVRSFSALPVIVYSAKNENSEKAFELGANEFLTKPFNIEEMMNKVRVLTAR